jgi:hypothetical protein
LLARVFLTIGLLLLAGQLAAQTPPELRIGRANHAFDHLGNIGGQADAAAASGATIIYTGGLGEAGYHGLPPKKDFEALCANVTAYSRHAKSIGIELPIGYLCATSIIKLDTFDKNWSPEFRSQFSTKPGEWRQQDRNSKPLASWYGGDYQPACMNNPDWRAYERAMVRYTLETGHAGVFFDNPTVHPQGCYCDYCMSEFSKVITPAWPEFQGGFSRDQATRKYAVAHPKQFLRFRSTIARNFLEDIRKFARTINPHALITCNNSLNSPDAFYSQCRTYAYNIDEMSKTEDFVVVEDMNTQPRTEANGETSEYGPTYKMLHAISHEKPVVAVTVAAADYHTAPHLMRLAMAEAAANGASYLSWPTWPENQRKRMIEAVRPQADFLRRNEALLNDAPLRADVTLFLPFQRWTETDHCVASDIAAALTKDNIQYRVVSEEGFKPQSTNGNTPVFLAEARSAFSPREESALKTIENSGGRIVYADKPNWMQTLQQTIGDRSIKVEGPPTVRAIVHDQPNRTIVHLYNLNVQRLSSFDDKVMAAKDIKIRVSLPFDRVGKVNVDTADEDSSRGAIQYTTGRIGDHFYLTATIPTLSINSIVVIEP